jgi:prepilin-type N-terminal cleavage/methylation domain-containing protein
MANLPPELLRNTRIKHCASGGSKGFTLIEMLVVIVICVTLAAWLYAGLQQSRKKANTVKCMAQLKSIGGSFFLYAADNNGAFPTMFKGGAPAPAARYWTYTLGPYNGLSSNEGIGVTSLCCPEKSSEPNGTSMYGANYPTVIALEKGQSGTSYLDISSKRLGIGVDSRAFLLVDATSAAVYSPNIWGLTRDADGDGVNDSSASFVYNRVDFRHSGRANFFLLNGAMVSLTTAQWGRNENNVWGRPL